MNSAHLNALHGVALFSGIDEEGLRFLTTGIRESRLPAGAVVIREGDVGRQLFVLHRGSVRVHRAGAHGEVELTRLHAPNYFGEMSILEEMPRSATVEAIGKVELLILPRIQFELLGERMPVPYARLLTNLARDLSNRLRRLGDEFARHH